MEKRFSLFDQGGKQKHLWTRDLAQSIRADLEKLFNSVTEGSTIVIDLKGVEVFDYSFANEFFGKILFALPIEYPGKFLIVENLTKYTNENLSNALESLGLIIIERKGTKLNLLGKKHPADQETFNEIVKAKKPMTAVELKDKLGTSINAMNERLSKLCGLSVVRKEIGVSQSGRQMYLYTVLA